VHAALELRLHQELAQAARARRACAAVRPSRPFFFSTFFSSSPYCCTQLPDEVGLHLQGGACCTAQLHGAAISMKHTGPYQLTHTRW